MGTWGPGNFDNDHALDAYAGLIDHIVEEIDEGFGEGEVYIEDVEGAIVLVEVLASLGEHCRKLYLPIAKIDDWKRRVLAAYDAQIDDLGADETFKVERRQVLERTFDRLRAVLHAGDG
ncbi:MAG TPA: DUF4259 domain-containing protein [Candidatus Nanopelagicales bacterium]|nr:DUF4259 domain-containing protein [Candidatus Nanopelagicales bacterium]